MTFERFDVVVVPFPFTDGPELKRRPALVLSDARSFNRPAGHCVMAMITSAHHSRWPLDVPLTNPAAAGLSSPSLVRMKLFTLAEEFLLSRKGALSPEDSRSVEASLRKLWGGACRTASPAFDAPPGAAARHPRGKRGGR